MSSLKRAYLPCIIAALLSACAKSPEATQPASEAQVTESSIALVRKSPWQSGDELGMANTIGNGTWVRCSYYLGLEGARSYELSHVRSNTMPMSPFGQPLESQPAPSTSIPGTRHVTNGDAIRSGEPGAQGTQMDALGHFAYYDQIWDGKGEPPLMSARYYGGFTQAEVKPTPESPLLKLGIDKAPPIITSAVLLDARAYVGKGSILEAGAMITAEDIVGMLMSQGLASRGLLPGDVLYIYTGWGDRWTDPDTEKTYYTRGPGLALDAARYIAERQVVLVALDNPFTDPVAEGQLAQQAAPPQGGDQGLPFIIHHTNLAVNGIHQIQNANLTAMAADKVWTSCTMILPLREKGQASSPVRPVAIGRPATR